jgi:hypothetical protein
MKADAFEQQGIAAIARVARRLTLRQAAMLCATRGFDLR